MMRVAVVGPGAIGTLVATSLRKVGVEVALIGRESHRRDLEGLPLQVTWPDGRVWQARVDFAPHRMLGDVAQRSDVVVVTVKAYDTGAVAEALASLVHPPYVLTLQNGVGNEEVLAHAVGETRVFSAALTTPVHVVRPGRVQVARMSLKMGLAPVSPSPESQGLLRRVGESFSSLGFRVRLFPDYRGLKWSKLLMNVTANAQAALLGWTPARIFAHPVAGRLEVEAWREALQVIKALRVRLVACGGYPLPWVTPLIRYLPAMWVRSLMGRFVAGGRGKKMPSVYLDVERGRGRTEVPWLNGAVVRAGEIVGVPTPVNRTLTRLVEAVAQGTVEKTVFRGRPERIWAEVERGG